MASKEDKEFSLVLCSTLDNLGFKRDNITLRSNFSEEKSQLVFSPMKAQGYNVYTITPAGSSAEGVQISGSDFDAMHVWEDAVCLDHEGFTENVMILKTDYTNTAPGYTKLYSINESVPHSPLSSILLMSRTHYNVGRYPYISSTKFRNLWCDSVLVNAFDKLLRNDGLVGDKTTNGPAVTHTITYGNHITEHDNVLSVYFYGDKHLPKWKNRARNYSWPSKDLVKEISEMEGNVVPVGDKQSENQNLEWRICFTTAEKKLISNLCEVQMKLYILLKLLSKYVLKTKCKALTSYVVKNVVFWITEMTPTEIFVPDNLILLVLKSLYFIKHCFENNHFPNYMIQERNLLKGAICGPEKRAILNFISECLTEGRHVIIRIPKLYQCMSIMVRNPESMVTYGRWNTEVERRFMDVVREKFNYHLQFYGSYNLRFFQRLEENNWTTVTQLKLFCLVVSPAELLSMLLSGKPFEDMSALYNKRFKLLELL